MSPFGSQIIHNFTRRIQSKIKDLLQQMEEGLKTADPHDCSAYTGWTGENMGITNWYVLFLDYDI